ncbi:MAG: SIMPL domain-containing protein [Clostridiaceae bacterium]
MYPQEYNGTLFNYYTEGPNSLLTVYGKGTVTVRPDQAEILIGVITEGQQLQNTQAENAKIAQQIIESIKRVGLEEKDIKTQDYSISIKYDYIDGKQVFKGYEVRNIFKVSIRDIRIAGLVIDTAVKNGANFVGNINFVVSETSGYYLQALRKAVEDAQSKAMAIGNKLNIRIDLIPVKIVEQETAIGPIFAAKIIKAAEGVTPVEPGESTITASIQAIFKYI